MTSLIRKDQAVDQREIEAPFFRLQWQQPGDTMTDIPPALLFRDGNIHGLLAEYHVGQRTLRRVEPYPYYGFFQETFAEPYSMHWRGHPNVPNPGGYRLEVVSKGAVATSIDGHALAAGTALSSGDHELLVNITDVHGAAQLQLFWQRGDASREFIPPSAFTPPLDQ